MLGNILSLALGVIPMKEAKLFRWIRRDKNEIGHLVDCFAPGTPLTGSIQPVDRTRYGYLGLDGSKSYITVYSPMLMQDLTRDANPDQIEYMGRRYKVINRSDWKGYADFTGVLAIDIGPAAGGETP